MNQLINEGQLDELLANLFDGFIVDDFQGLYISESALRRIKNIIKFTFVSAKKDIDEARKHGGVNWRLDEVLIKWFGDSS